MLAAAVYIFNQITNKSIKLKPAIAETEGAGCGKFGAGRGRLVVAVTAETHRCAQPRPGQASAFLSNHSASESGDRMTDFRKASWRPPLWGFQMGTLKKRLFLASNNPF